MNLFDMESQNYISGRNDPILKMCIENKRKIDMMNITLEYLLW